MQTLILTHGALGSSADLDKLAEALQKENYNVFTFSFSGHGNTDFETDFDIEQFTLELQQFILKNALVQPSVIGFSMGGYVALNLARRSPEIIDKIITLGTKFNWSKEVVEKEVKLLDAEVMLTKVPAFAKSLELKHGEKWKTLLLRTAQLMRGISANNYLNPESLINIKNKTLVGLGDKDQMVTLEETISVYRSLPKANMYILPNAKHPIEQLNSTLFVAVIKDFLRD